eukprot:3569226-Pleurochrysis_carterae.AAC.1
MNGDAGAWPSSQATASAKRSLQTAIDGTPERPDADPGRVGGNDNGPDRLDCDLPSSFHAGNFESS